jgi:hypothetical protein
MNTPSLPPSLPLTKSLSLSPSLTPIAQVVVGTHALLQPTVSFTNLGLLIIDEEQRFGVAHKEKLKVSKWQTDRFKGEQKERKTDWLNDYLSGE